MERKGLPRAGSDAEISNLARLADREGPDETDAYVHALRDELKAIKQEHGAVRIQIGRAYGPLGTRELRFAALLRQIKLAVEPQRLLNPGSLGF